MNSWQYFLELSSRIRSKVVSVLTAFFVIGFAGVSNVSANVPDGTGIIEEAGDIIELVLDVEGIKRENFWYGGFYRGFNYYIPPNVKPDAPLLVHLHTLATGATTMRLGLDIRDVADREGFIVMWPEGATDITFGLGLTNSWNAGQCCQPAMVLNVDDNGFIRNAIDRMQGKVSIDESRIYVFGVSNGGAMSHRLGLESADKIAAIVPIVYPLTDNWTWRIPNSWKSDRKTPVLVMQSKDDFVVPYGGGPSIGDLRSSIAIWLDGAEQSRQNWADLNGCTGYEQKPFFEQDPNGPYIQTHADCDQDVTVSLLTFKKGGHGPLYPFLNGGVNLKEEIWSFFQQYQKPGSGSNHLIAGQELEKGQYIISNDKNIRLKLESNGDLRLKDLSEGDTLWKSNTSGSSADRLVVQTDGNLVLYADGYWGWKKKKAGWFTYYVWSYFSAKAVWSSGTYGQGNSDLILKVSDQGYVSLISGGHTIWSKD